MAGGKWTSQNKKQPGVYINVKSRQNISSQAGDRGVVAIAKALSWGAVGVMQVIDVTPGIDTTPYVGYDITSEQAIFLREMLKGSDTTDGPIKILLYRLAGTNGAKATAKIGTLTATALYEGVRGNDITVIVQADPDAAATYEVITAVDGGVVDTQKATAVAGLKANQWVTFSGEGALAANAGTKLAGGKDATVAAGDYAKFLTALEPYTCDILAYDGSDATIKQSFASYAKRVSENIGMKCQAVVADALLNSEWVISVRNGVELDDGTKLTANQAVWWVAGAQAGARYNQSLTYAQYPNAVAANPKLTDAQVDTAISEGQIVFVDTFDAVKVCVDINTLTSFTVDKGQAFSKNRVMRALNQFCNDVYKQFSLYYIGKVNNNEEGRALLKAWIVGYLNEMQANNGIQNFAADDVLVEAGNTSDAVVVSAALQPVDSVEKIYMTVTVSASTETE